VVQLQVGSKKKREGRTDVAAKENFEEVEKKIVYGIRVTYTQ
jgi:hypothetical protein